jgi:hypothetical protein
MTKADSTYGKKLQQAKLLFVLAVCMVVAKPFIGFLMNRSNATAQTILVKSFTKRKQDYIENGGFDVKAVQSKLADPVPHVFAPFAILSGILFLSLVTNSTAPVHQLNRTSKFGLSLSAPIWLINDQVII